MAGEGVDAGCCLMLLTSLSPMAYFVMQVLPNATYTGPNGAYTVTFDGRNAPGTHPMPNAVADVRFLLLACSSNCMPGRCTWRPDGVGCDACLGDFEGEDCDQCRTGALVARLVFILVCGLLVRGN